MFYVPLRTFVLTSPGILIGTFVTSIGFLIACHVYAHSHPTNLYLMAGFTLSMAWSVATTCGAYASAGLGMAVLQARVRVGAGRQPATLGSPLSGRARSTLRERTPPVAVWIVRAWTVRASARPLRPVRRAWVDLFSRARLG